MCSYSSGIFPNYFLRQLQFLSLGGLFSYTGRPFTGTRPPFPPAPLSFRSLQAGQPRILGKNSGSGCTASKKISGTTVLVDAERTKSLEKNSMFGCRANSIPMKNSTFGCRASKIPGQTAGLGAERTKSLETALLGAQRTKSLG